MLMRPAAGVPGREKRGRKCAQRLCRHSPTRLFQLEGTADAAAEKGGSNGGSFPPCSPQREERSGARMGQQAGASPQRWVGPGAFQFNARAGVNCTGCWLSSTLFPLPPNKGELGRGTKEQSCLFISLHTFHAWALGEQRRRREIQSSFSF